MRAFAFVGRHASRHTCVGCAEKSNRARIHASARDGVNCTHAHNVVACVFECMRVRVHALAWSYLNDHHLRSTGSSIPMIVTATMKHNVRRVCSHDTIKGTRLLIL